MSRLRNRLGWILVACSLFLHFFTVFCYVTQPDRLAAFTVAPIWIWGSIGLFLSCFAFCFLRAALSMVVSLVWVITLLVGADEAHVLAHLTTTPPKPGAAALYHDQPVVRVLTLNCAAFTMGSPTDDIEYWQPDIVLLQEIQPYQVREIAERLYGGTGDYRAYHNNGVITRWKISAETHYDYASFQQLRISLPDQRDIDLINVHLLSAATDLRLWEKDAWKTHYKNRVTRKQELSAALQVLEQTTQFPNTPALVCGDFNAPAWDQVHHLLSRDFTNAFAAAGTGWGNTFQRRLPVLRIDHIYSTYHFTPVRCRAVTTRHSDHRLVVADFLFK